MKRTLCLLALLAALTLRGIAASAPYRLQARDGVVCIYDPALGWQTTGCCLSTLPYTARAELQRGLIFASRAALTAALESYCS